MRLIRKAHLAPGVHECAYMSFKPSERDGTWIELLLADPAQVGTFIHKPLSFAASVPGIRTYTDSQARVLPLSYLHQCQYQYPISAAMSVLTA